MRDANRLYYIYGCINRKHVENCPDIRVGQFFVNFAYWCKQNKKIDLFYLEDDKILEYIGEYVGQYLGK